MSVSAILIGRTFYNGAFCCVVIIGFGQASEGSSLLFDRPLIFYFLIMSPNRSGCCYSTKCSLSYTLLLISYLFLGILSDHMGKVEETLSCLSLPIPNCRSISMN